ncbi:cysteine alpha-hairpin motif superfamily [Lipomyces arxii]|uniref:cysteine alpha-hairpin motif superfamily n=1 Tax=Lipomyces arxii TaxID=56418 RepID=UPI0034CE9CA7
MNLSNTNIKGVESVDSSPSCAKPFTETKQDRPKPCCVCIDEKMARDECMLMSPDGRTECKDFISTYKTCMRGYGFNV